MKQTKVVNGHLQHEEKPNFRSRPLENVTISARTEQSKSIVLVDLCSSDEEEVTDEPVLADENCDPLSISGNGVVSNYLKNPVFQSSKFRPNGQGFPSEPSNGNDWSRDNVLTIDNDRCSNNKRLTQGVLDSYISFTPLLKPAP